MQNVRTNYSTGQRSRRQKLAQSEASGTLGSDSIFHQARSRIILWSIPRAALRFTSFRFTSTPAGLPRRGRRIWPGLNSAAGSLSLILLSLTIACGKKEPPKKTADAPTPPASADHYPNLAVQAKELTDSFDKKAYARFV